MAKKIEVEVSLIKYLKDLTKEWDDKVFVTKTYGGHVWISDEAPGEMFKEEGLNYIEFNDSGIYMRLSKELHQHFEIKKGKFKELKEIFEELEEQEKSLNEEIIITIALAKYLRDITKEWGDKIFLNKTYEDHIWLSSDTPGVMVEGNMHAEFNNSDIVMQIPKEMCQQIELEKGTSRELKKVLKELKEKEKLI